MRCGLYGCGTLLLYRLPGMSPRQWAAMDWTLVPAVSRSGGAYCCPIDCETTTKAVLHDDCHMMELSRP